jgi:NADP-dependent 3-hydroxy acid dehydrogenase YdfG
VDHAVQSHGRIDVIINNAGLMPHSPLERGNVQDWERMIDVNIKDGIAAALPHMKAQRSGHIINVSSVAGHAVRPGSAVYAATKTAVRVISEGLRQEVKPYNIRTTVISPGAIATELPDSSCKHFTRILSYPRLAILTPLGRSLIDGVYRGPSH